jgi:ectoine hydroxylase-related dioxygenase (phytanoyl-CoA dioxygenase family)
VTCPMKAGDASVHAGWTLHSALGNTTDRAREAAAISYYPEGTYVWKDLTPIRLNDLRICMPGVEPGALAIGPKNPRV